MAKIRDRFSNAYQGANERNGRFAQKSVTLGVSYNVNVLMFELEIEKVRGVDLTEDLDNRKLLKRVAVSNGYDSHYWKHLEGRGREIVRAVTSSDELERRRKRRRIRRRSGRMQ